MSDINWQNGAVCYGDGRQWFANTDYESDKLELVNNDGSRKYSLYGILNFPKNFQLNEITTGDFIPASELDTEQKYNEVVEVFGLFGAEDAIGYKGFTLEFCNLLLDGEYGIVAASNGVKLLTRQLTYPQIIAIGKLKRMMLEREKSAPKTTPDLTPDLTPDNTDQVKNPSHYQLIEGVESIEIIARSMTQEQWKGYCLGNMLKYRIRAGKKDALQQDIDKANFYGDLYEMHKEKCYDQTNNKTNA